MCILEQPLSSFMVIMASFAEFLASKGIFKVCATFPVMVLVATSHKDCIWTVPGDTTL